MDTSLLAELTSHLAETMCNPIPLEQVWAAIDIIPCEEFIF